MWGNSYDEPEDSKKVDLAEPREDPRSVCIAIDLSSDEEDLLIYTLKEYRDVFSWRYKDLKGVDRAICQHTIPMRDDTKTSKQRPYMYNEKLTTKLRRKLINY